MARLVDRALRFMWPLTQIYSILKRGLRLTTAQGGATTVKFEEPNVSKKTRETPQSALLDADCWTIFDIEPDAEPEGPLRIDLNLDQLEDFGD